MKQAIDSWEKLIEKLLHDGNDVCQQVANGIDKRAQWTTSSLSRYLKFFKFIAIQIDMKTHTNNTNNSEYDQCSKRCHFYQKLELCKYEDQVELDKCGWNAISIF